MLLQLPVNNSGFLARNATRSTVKRQVFRTLGMFEQEHKLQARLLERARNPYLMMDSRLFPSEFVAKGEAVGVMDSAARFSQINESEKKGLLESGINPLHIGYGVEDFELATTGPEFDSGNDDGGKEDGGSGDGGNDGQGPNGSEPNDGLTGLTLWWFWQRNHSIRTHKRSRTTTQHFLANDLNQLIYLAVDVMSPTDMTKFVLLTNHYEDMFLVRLLIISFLPWLYELVDILFIEVPTMFFICGASALISGGVVYSLQRWHKGVPNYDSSEDDTGPQLNDPTVQ